MYVPESSVDEVKVNDKEIPLSANKDSKRKWKATKEKCKRDWTQKEKTEDVEVRTCCDCIV